MTNLHKRDISISMENANIYGIIFALPIVIIQLTSYTLVYGVRAFKPGMNVLLLVVIVFIGIAAHEIIHGIAWSIFGNKPISAIKFGFLWKTLSPYAHCKETMDVAAYRWGTFMPGLLLGFLPFFIAIFTGDSSFMWFGLFHSCAACGDWLVLWIIRTVKPGSLVEDHPTNAGIYVLEG
jgi:hypothetical protein